MQFVINDRVVIDNKDDVISAYGPASRRIPEYANHGFSHDCLAARRTVDPITAVARSYAQLDDKSIVAKEATIALRIAGQQLRGETVQEDYDSSLTLAAAWFGGKPVTVDTVVQAVEQYTGIHLTTSSVEGFFATGPVTIVGFAITNVDKYSATVVRAKVDSAKDDYNHDDPSAPPYSLSFYM